MGPEQLALDGQRHIDEGLVMEQLVEDVEQVALMVVPAQTEPLRRHRSFASQIRQVTVDVR